MNQNVEKFQKMLSEDKNLRNKLQAAADAYNGNKADDRKVFETIALPVARSIGLDITYEEACEAAMDGCELTDDELELVVGGAGTMYRRLISGALAATLIFGSIPAHAFAQQDNSGSKTKAQTEQVVELGESEVSVTEQVALDAINNYSPSFSDADIATPAGIAATANGLMAVGNMDALTVASFAAEADGGKTSRWDKAKTAIDYTTKALGYVNSDAAKIGEYGKTIFDFIKSGVSGDFGGVFDGGLELLKLIGVIEEQGGNKGVTNEDLQKDIKDLQKLTEGMSARLDEGVKQTYQNRLVTFDNAIGALGIDCGQAERMFKKADKLAKERGLLDLPESNVPPVPEMPALPEMPAELAQDAVLPEEPAEPQISFANTMASPYKVKELLLSSSRIYLRHANEQGESVPYTDEEVTEIVAMCDQAIAEHEQAKADWQAECDRIVAEHERARSNWKWNATLQQNEEYRKLYEAWVAETEDARNEYQARLDAYRKGYTAVLVKLMREEAKAGNNDFLNFDTLMNRIETNFDLVAVECAKSEGASPFFAWDSYWKLHFNWESQGYYLRQAYRSRAEYMLKRSYALLASYYDMPSVSGKLDEEDVRYTITEALGDALNGIEAIPAGVSPEDVLAAGKGNKGIVNLHCNSLNRDVKRLVMATFYGQRSNVATDAQIKEYATRLHGKSLLEDLELAGLTNESVSRPSTSYGGIGFRTVEYTLDMVTGLVMRSSQDDDTWDYAKILYQNGDWNEARQYANRYYIFFE